MDAQQAPSSEAILDTYTGWSKGIKFLKRYDTGAVSVCGEVLRIAERLRFASFWTATRFDMLSVTASSAVWTDGRMKTRL